MPKEGFHLLQGRILTLARAHVRDGHFTERGLARHLGLSQPHVHNILCGVRPVTPEVLGLMLRGFRLSLLDLFTTAELKEHVDARERLSR